jgi:hypothetical protein
MTGLNGGSAVAQQKCNEKMKNKNQKNPGSPLTHPGQSFKKYIFLKNLFFSNTHIDNAY